MNAALALAHFRMRDWFGALPASNQPYWWPEGVGRALSDWGLMEVGDDDDVRQLTASLCLSTDSPGPHPFDAFCGSVGTERTECRYWVLLDTPPRREHEAAMRLRLPRWLNTLGITTSTHVTSVQKVRGGLAAHAPPALRADVASVLAEEWTSVPPRLVLCAPGARDSARRLLADAAVPDDARADIAAMLRADYVERPFPADADARRWADMAELWRSALLPEDAVAARTRG
jgi:hypothetical protein